MIQVAWKGISSLLKALDAEKKNKKKSVARALTKSAILVQSTARKKILEGPKTGRYYGKARYVRAAARGSKKPEVLSKVHRASAPGEAPANDTGNLMRKIQIVKVSDEEITIVSKAEYSKHLEFGTAEILPRPFMQPSLEENVENIQKIMKEEILK